MNHTSSISAINLALVNSISYSEYLKLLDKLVDTRATTGSRQSEALATYTAVNYVRIKRLHKRLTLCEDLQSTLREIDHRQTWLFVTESWCGDASHILPVLARMVELNKNLNLRIVLRDNNPELMKSLPGGDSISIPKLAVLNETGKIEAHWGPRPAKLQKVFIDYKNNPGPKIPYSEFSEVMHKWYSDDRGRSIQKEFNELLKDTLTPVSQNVL